MIPKPVISVCMPSFRRIERCEAAIKSIVAACDDPRRIEICLRLQIGDDASLRHIPEFLTLAPTVRIVVGLTYGGYTRHHLFFNDVARIADGTWSWFIDDDITVERGPDGVGIDTLMAAQKDDSIVLPSHYKLGPSGYDRCSDTPAVFMPSSWWGKYEIAKEGPPLDRAIFLVLRNKQKKKTRFVDFEYHHHHDTPEAWLEHKAGVT